MNNDMKRLHTLVEAKRNSPARACFVLAFSALTILVVTVPVFAQTAAPTVGAVSGPTAVPTNAVTKDVQNLKDKLATKVSELRKQNQKAISGVIADINTKTITIRDAEDKSVQVKIDEVLTLAFEISGTVKRSVKVDTLEKGDYIIISGPVTDSTVTANTIYKDEQYLVGSGKITKVLAADFSLAVATEDKENLTIVVENTTRRLLVDSKTLTKEVIGFTKIKEGDTVHYVLKKTGREKVKDQFGALRIVIIPQEYFVAK